MGTLMYGSPPSPIEFDDRTLAHLKVVIVSKLRRNEPFLLSWPMAESSTVGRESLWMHPSIPLRFTFETSVRPQLNPAWLNELSRSAMTNDGLHVTPEPVDAPVEDVTPPAAGHPREPARAVKV